MKTAAAATPSYHSAWDLAHGRMAEADEERRAWLDKRLEEDRNRPPISHRESSRLWMQKMRNRRRVPCACGGMKHRESIRCAACVKAKP